MAKLLTNYFPVNFLTEQDGSGLVEFALSAILLFTILFGILEVSRAVYVGNFVANAAREATRYAAVRGATWSASCSTPQTAACKAASADVSTFVKSIAPNGVSPGNLTVTTNWPGTNAAGATCTTNGATAYSPGCVVSVQVAYNFTFVVPLLPSGSFSIPSTSQVTIEQ